MAPSNEKKLTPRQEKALAALITQPTVALAAAQAGVGERSIVRWMGEDAVFKSEYLKLRREIINHAVFQMHKSANNAVNTLISVMNDPEASASARVAAAVKVLELSFKAIETDDLEVRITTLEQDRADRNLRGSNGASYGHR
jgi:hypothetical protein